MTQDRLNNGIKSETIFTGNNLHILRGMDSDCIDLIYLDPPFNSNRNYAAPIGSEAAGAEFKDTWKWNDDIHTYWLDVLKKDHPKIGDLIQILGDINGKSDKAYLTYMAPRLIHMHRVLKKTGSLYLHCDPTMSHGLKILLDAIFGGRKNFRNEIVWNYGESSRGAKATSKFWAKNYDNLFFYTKSGKYNYKKIIWEKEYTIQEAKKKGFQEDENGEWFKTAPRGDYTDESIERLRKEGRIHVNTKGTIRIKYPLRKNGIYIYEKIIFGNVWTDIPDIMHTPGEKTGYPTQKPLKLLERIIEASSHEGDWVLDPFCGCATTCLAAGEKGRKWIGIDVAPKSFDLVKLRFKKELPLYTLNAKERTDCPRQSGFKVPPKKELRNTLYGKQHGNCNGCQEHFIHPRHFHLDHIVPTSKGGQEHEDNKQLLCGSCNSTKGDKDMPYLIRRLIEFEVIPPQS